MLLDNKNQTSNDPKTVVDYLQRYTETGRLDLVTGFFSVNALAFLHDRLNRTEKFRLILGNLMQDEAHLNKVIDLLNDDAGIMSALSLRQSAQQAVDFLKQDKVGIKMVQKNFCHAKSYIYQDSDSRKNYHIIGSSNLTDAGLGMRESANIELNMASTGENNDWKEVNSWFEHLWKKIALDKIELPDRTRITAKQHIIDLISTMFKEYSPKDLYYKVLYELFKDDLLALSSDAEFNREIKHLSETLIYRTLYPYQQNGVISLIKMLRKYNGAILADAVGLGKTWTALAVIKYFQSKGYTIVLFCPKKLENNWKQYQYGSGKASKFEKDEIEYLVRYHSDLQDDRMDKNHYPDYPLSKIQRKQNLLLVIDESHNLRNDKSSRYKYLVENVLQPEKTSRDVKVLQLSATPVNNKLLDIRNQFKLMTKGQDAGFKTTPLEINSLEYIFRNAQRDYTLWSKKPNRKIVDFIAQLSENFFQLTDALIVARTRKMIQSEFGAMNFPQKAEPENIYITPENIGKLKSFEDILEATTVKMAAYQPSKYILERRKGDFSAIEDEVARETFLVKMMQILMIKRLESSWYSFKLTVENILKHHDGALEKVNQFIENKKDEEMKDNFVEDDFENLDEATEETLLENDFTLGKKNPVKLSEITALQTFKRDLERDVNKLRRLKENLDEFERKFNEPNLLNQSPDLKLEKLLDIIRKKQSQENRKVLIFTVYSDTANFLYRELKKHFKNLAFVSGSASATDDGYSGKDFEPILERFAPYTKLYNEKDWTELYEKVELEDEYFVEGKWNVSYDKWREIIEKHDKKTWKKLQTPIDILIATDCLSEGQNLQDCDLIVNYDIHWNPVRLIQRMGRIDRLGSPNATIAGVNFWPAKSFEDYLQLKTRVEIRMAAMTLVGTEIEVTTAELQKMVKDNPLISEQTQKMLQQMQLTWDDIEDGDETLGLNDLSLEKFRQDLFEFFKKNEEFFKRMPNGIFTGFHFIPDRKHASMPDSIVAVLGYPRRPENAKDWVYPEIHILHQTTDGEPTKTVLQNRQEILDLLRHHKEERRYVPKDVDQGKPEELKRLSGAVSDWLQQQIMPTAIQEIQNQFTENSAPAAVLPEQPNVEEIFRAENFDLINWFIISGK
ncbi:MAG: phospholipase D-like domain-containing protein [Tannerella sp.]|nr:phospholipase D-like domain-containing protein [Tannerella sp.]